MNRFLCLQTSEMENVEPCEQYLLERNVSIGEAKLFDQYQNLFEFVQKYRQPNAISCKMMKHERLAKYFATCDTTEWFSELRKFAQFYFIVMAHCVNVERFFHSSEYFTVAVKFSKDISAEPVRRQKIEEHVVTDLDLRNDEYRPGLTSNAVADLRNDEYRPSLTSSAVADLCNDEYRPGLTSSAVADLRNDKYIDLVSPAVQ